MDIVDILAEALLEDPQAITADFVFTDHENWDSLAELSLVTGIEDVYGVVITGSEVKSVHTVDELAELIKSKT